RGAFAYRLRIGVALAAVTSAGLATALWQSERPGAVGVPTFAAPDASTLGAGDAWIADSFQQLVVEELVDAWKIEPRVGSATAGTDGPVVALRIWRNAQGQLQAAVDFRGAPRVVTREVRGGSLRELSQAAGTQIVESLVPAAARHPVAAELRAMG